MLQRPRLPSHLLLLAAAAFCFTLSTATSPDGTPLPDVDDLEFVSLHGYFSFPLSDSRSGQSYLGTTAPLVHPGTADAYGSVLQLYHKVEDRFIRVVVDTRRLLEDHLSGKTCVLNPSRRYYRAVAETKILGFANPPWDEPWDSSNPTGEPVEMTMQNDDLSECRMDVGEISTQFHDRASDQQGISWIAAGDDLVAVSPESMLEVTSVEEDDYDDDQDDHDDGGKEMQSGGDDESREEHGGGDDESREEDGGGDDESREEDGGGDGDLEQGDDRGGELREEDEVGEPKKQRDSGSGEHERDSSKKTLATGVSEVDTEMSQVGERRYAEGKLATLMALAYAMQESARLRVGSAVLYFT
ncbi:hypothetical protein FOZ63_012896 [Perkinsus olseni]|nr:hypothetical protein FOZ63_012896 [Perkinsus olseni]